MPPSVRLGLAATVSSLLVACGGGGGGNPGATTPPPVVVAPPTAPTAEDLANAGASQMKVTLRPDTKYLTISWTDTFPSETGYRVEARAPDGTWQTIASAPAGNATGGPFEIARTIDAAGTYRVSALVAGYTVPLQTAAGQSEIPVELAPPLGVIGVDLSTFSDAALQGTVQPRFDYGFYNDLVEEVTYYLGNDVLGSTSSQPFLGIVWETETVPDGSYELLAIARLTSGAFVEARREIAVDNVDDFAASLEIARVAGSLTDFEMSAKATASIGIRSVDFFFDGNRVQTLPGVAGRDYSFTLVTSGLTAGTHTFKVVATDNAAETVEATRQVSIDNPPALTLAAPLQDRIVTSSLHIEGTFGDEQPGATLNVALGDATFLQTSTAGAFDIDRSLTGVAPGEYTLIVRAVDSQGHQTVETRNVIVEPSQTAVELIATDVQEILDVDQGAVLFMKRDGTVHLRDGSGTEVTLQIPLDPRLFFTFDLSAGHVAAAWGGHVYVFDSTGHPTNLSETLGTASNHDLRLSYPWLTWDADLGEFHDDQHVEIYNLVTQARTSLAPLTAIGDSALIATAGAEQLLYSAHVSGVGSGERFNIFLYDFASATTQKLTVDALYRDVQTDNVRLAWGRMPHFNASLSQTQLVVASLANPTAQATISTAASEFTLRDGLLAWMERNSDGTAELKVDDGISTTEITPSATSAMVVADGRLTFQENGKVYVWQSGTAKRVVLNSLPSQALLHDDGVGFFTRGGTPSHTLYRIQLP